MCARWVLQVMLPVRQEQLLLKGSCYIPWHYTMNTVMFDVFNRSVYIYDDSGFHSVDRYQDFVLVAFLH